MIKTKSVLTPTEEEVRQILLAEGWTVLRKGWPDFLCIRPDKPSTVIAVEVKSVNDGYSPEQQTVISALGEFFPVFGFMNGKRMMLARPYAAGELDEITNRPMF